MTQKTFQWIVLIALAILVGIALNDWNEKRNAPQV